ncbi:MAG TPA: helix-turn-helix domain-containing protein [Arsenophonus nasoniae]|uniref:HVO_A0114 family putative DNA-binding protein n=1 Tax=Arsenophonus nasoniae TaxID=638 RepID=UPI00387A2709
MMNTLIVKVMSEQSAWEQMTADFKKTLSGKQIAEPFVHIFPSIEQLTKVMLQPNRLNIINVMAGAEPMSIRELARRLNRDFRAVHRDVKMMLDADIIERDDDKIVFPFKAVHFDFTIENKAA